jgi:hypothetical protein
MTRRERLWATIRGEKVDRPAVSFHEIGGFVIDPDDPDEYNIYNSISWRPLLELAENETDIIKMVSPVRAQSHLAWDGSDHTGIRDKYVKEKTWEEGNSKFTRITYKINGKELTSTTRRDKELDTVWTIEHLLKDTDDVKLFLQLPDDIFVERIDITPMENQEKSLGDSGIVMVDTEDPICAVAALFSMEDFTVFAFTEQELCHRMLEKHAKYIYKRTTEASAGFPGRFWRIYGPEYATEPFLPLPFFEEYVVRYTGPMVKMIKEHGGYVRIHSHGRVSDIIEQIVKMGGDATDPLEPFPHGNADLRNIRERYGKDLVLFGNIEISDIESLPSERFRELVRKTLEDGTYGKGRGFVLMPTASPYGRTISEQTLKNYEIMIEEVKANRFH